MAKFSHLFAIGFNVVSDREDADDVTPEMFRAALLQRVRELEQFNEWLEALGPPEETDALD